MEFQLKTELSPYLLEAGVRLIGDDLLVAIWGGEKPHIGAVAVAQPRPSLRPPHDLVSATASVICLPGHKEDVLAKSVAETLSALINRPVVVSAGMHWPRIDAEGIAAVEENCRLLIGMIVDQLKERGVPYLENEGKLG